MAATPTVVPKSPAICGRSESVTGTWAWLAKPATASRTIERVGLGAAAGDGLRFTGTDSRFGRQPPSVPIPKFVLFAAVSDTNFGIEGHLEVFESLGSL